MSNKNGFNHQHLQNIEEIIETKTGVTLPVKNTPKYTTNKWVLKGATATMVVLLAFAFNFGLFDFGNHGQPGISPPGSENSGAVVQQPQKRGFALVAYAAESPEYLSNNLDVSPQQTTVKRGVDGFLTLDTMYHIERDIVVGTESERYLQSYILYLNINSNDIKDCAVKSTNNARLIDFGTGIAMVNDEVIEIEALENNKIVEAIGNRVWYERYGGQEGLFGIATDGKTPAIFLLEVTFTDGETETYTVTITPQKDNAESPVAKFEINLD